MGSRRENQQAVLVTGGSGGIGSMTVRALAAAGGSVMIADIDAVAGAAVARELTSQGHDVRFTQCDVTDPSQVRDAVDLTVSCFGRLDAAANVAGIAGDQGSVADQTDRSWAEVIAVNLTGVFHSLREELRVMAQQGYGAIVNVGSISGLVGGRELAPYIASKHGVLGLTKAAAVEYGGQGIRVNAVCPAFTDTKMISDVGVIPGTPAWDHAVSVLPLGRIGQPAEIARSIAWLLSDESSFLTGACIPVDGGYTAQ